MKPTDKVLGMSRNITRRDFIHDSSLLALGMGLGLNVSATDASGVYYPPTLTGLRGSHPGSYESAHALAREGKSFPTPTDLDETYDLVVVGAGISGLAAAHYYRKRFGPDARILLLENHDDFGGHAKRNEFHQGGQMRLSMGGTHNLEHWEFSDTVDSFLAELGVDIPAMMKDITFNYGRNGDNQVDLWFSAEKFGEDKLVKNATLRYRREIDSLDFIEEIPISVSAKIQLKKLYTDRRNDLAGKSEAEVEAYLRGISYTDFLRKHGGGNEEVLALFATATHGDWGLDTRALSAMEAFDSGLPGMTLVGFPPYEEGFYYPVGFFPDGNASVARLQVQALIPAVAPGVNADNVAVAHFDYSQLDRPDSAVRVRLNSTVINAVNTNGGVAITYLAVGQSNRVRARHSVLACYHSIIPHLCPDLSSEQKTAQRYQVKTPMLMSNVLLRSSAAMDKLGITGANCPGRMHENMYLFKGINTGGYQHSFDDKGPVPLVMFGTISPPNEAVTIEDQWRGSRAKMLGLSFEDYEREIRTVLHRMLSPAGFDVNKDILAITVNRWPHGYAREYMDLWDPDWPEGREPHRIASRPHGNITFANADAGASAYTHTAIDEAFRAVNELPAAVSANVK
ncbi:MAG: NAD(P)-binding protein [Halioglobus sp.]